MKPIETVTISQWVVNTRLKKVKLIIFQIIVISTITTFHPLYVLDKRKVLPVTVSISRRPVWPRETNTMLINH